MQLHHHRLSHIFNIPFRHRTHNCGRQDLVSPTPQVQNVRHNVLPLVHLLETVSQMLAFLPPSGC